MPPWEKYQTRRKPWEKYGGRSGGQVQEQPDMPAQRATRSAQTEQEQPPQPRQGEDQYTPVSGAPVETSFDPRPPLSKIAREAGVSTEGASIAARFDLNLAEGAVDDTKGELALARRALERDLGKPVEVRVGPDTNQLEFKPEGEDSFTLVNRPGLDVGDIGGAAPEAGSLGAGVVAGVGLGAVGGATPLGPAGAGAGVVLGEGVGEGLAEMARLSEARDRGLIDLSDEEITKRALKRGGIASAATAGGGLALRTFRRLASGVFGIDPKTVEAVGGVDALEEGVEQTAKRQRRIEEASGEEFPVTSGQATGSQEALRAEQRARGFRESGQRLRNIDEQQDRAIGEIEGRIFGTRAKPEEVERAGKDVASAVTAQERKSTRPATTRRDAAQREAGEQEQEAFERARGPESTVASARERIDSAREQVFEPFHRQFNDLQSESGIRVDLGGFRKEANRLLTKEGQDILRSVSLQSQSRLVREARRAGQKEAERLELGPDRILRFVKKLEDEPPTLGETQRALRDIRRELRRPGIADEPQRERLLTRLKKSLEQARNQAAQEADDSGETLANILRLEARYAEESRRFDEGIVGKFTETDRFGQPRLAGEDALDRLLKNPENADSFVTATGSMPNGNAVLQDTRDGVMGLIRRRYIDDDGNLREAQLRTFLQNNRDSLERLFAGDKQALNSLRSAQKAASLAKREGQKLETIRNRFRKRFGFATDDPAAMVNRLFGQDSSVQDFRAARNVLKKHMPDRVKIFDRAVARRARDRMVNNRGEPTPERIGTFIDSQAGEIAKGVFGKKYTQNLETLADALALRGERAAPGAPQDLGGVFRRGVPALEGVARFLRVAFPPLSPRGRGLTAALGVASEQSRRRIAEALADPEKLAALARLSNVSVNSEIAEKTLGRLGFDAFLAMRDASNEAPSREDRPVSRERRQGSAGSRGSPSRQPLPAR